MECKLIYVGNVWGPKWGQLGWGERIKKKHRNGRKNKLTTGISEHVLYLDKLCMCVWCMWIKRDSDSLFCQCKVTWNFFLVWIVPFESCNTLRLVSDTYKLQQKPGNFSISCFSVIYQWDPYLCCPSVHTLTIIARFCITKKKKKKNAK